MRPTLASLDQRDRSLTHAEESANLPLRQSLLKQFPDLAHAILGKLGAPVPLSASQSSVADPIRHVLGLSTPHQILDSVVAGIPVQMSAFHSGRTRSHESRENKPVNGHFLAASSDGENDLKMPASLSARSENAPSKRTLARSDTFHVSPVGHLVGSFVFDDGSPDFDVDFGNNTGRIHDAFFL